MDKRTEWKLSCHHLRELFKEFRERGPDNRNIYQYKFGLTYNPMFRYFHLWNGLAKNTIATIRVNDNSDKVVIRIRPNSFYRYEIEKLTFPDKKTIIVPSENLSRNRAWVRSRLQSRVEQRIAEVREAFLAPQTQATEESVEHSTVYHIPVLQHPTEVTFGPSTQRPLLVETQIVEVRVMFGSEQEMTRYRDEAHHMVRQLAQMEALPPLSPSGGLTFDTLYSLFRGHDRQSVGSMSQTLTNRTLINSSFADEAITASATGNRWDVEAMRELVRPTEVADDDMDY